MKYSRPFIGFLLLAAPLTITALLWQDSAGYGSGDSAVPAASLPTCPSSISFGETIECSIDAPAEIDTYTFTANAGDKVLLRMSNTGALWSGVSIYAGSTKLCEASDPTTAEIASCILSGGSSYTIHAYDSFNGTLTGTYYLYLQRLNNPGNTLPIDYGQTLSGSIDSPAEMDAYTFTAGAEDHVLVRMSKNGALWSAIRLYGPDGTKLCEASDPTTAEIADCSLSADGPHTILAYDGFNGALTGTYNLTQICLTAPCGPSGTPTPTPMPMLKGDMDCDGDVDALDSLRILRHVAALPVNLPAGCPAIGSPSVCLPC